MLWSPAELVSAYNETLKQVQGDFVHSQNAKRR